MKNEDIVLEKEKTPTNVDVDSFTTKSDFIPWNDFGFKTVEIKDKENKEKLYDSKGLDRFRIINNSDAHYLWDMSERENYLEVESFTLEAIIHILSR